ncbi:hypothetical protein GCM10011341_18350 [Frigidibacter albus]|nr:hypothetical protein GCM10011341_18350 [Frigidibacter albus]
MADQTVKIAPNDFAAVAYQMAISLWINEHNGKPKASDGKFLKLVSLCSDAVRGGGNDFETDVANLFRK